MLMDLLLSCFQHASLVLMTFILRYFYSLFTFHSEILNMGGRNYRVWWPQQLLTSTSSSGLLLFGWFMDSVDSIDIVVATAIPSAKMMTLPLQTNIEVREMLECYLCTFSVWADFFKEYAPICLFVYIICLLYWEWFEMPKKIFNHSFWEILWCSQRISFGNDMTPMPISNYVSWTWDPRCNNEIIKIWMTAHILDEQLSYLCSFESFVMQTFGVLEKLMLSI